MTVLDGKEGSIILVKNLKCNDYKGKRTANTTTTTSITVLNPDLDTEARTILDWWSAEGYVEIFEEMILPLTPDPNE